MGLLRHATIPHAKARIPMPGTPGPHPTRSHTLRPKTPQNHTIQAITAQAHHPCPTHHRPKNLQNHIQQTHTTQLHTPTAPRP